MKVFIIVALVLLMLFTSCQNKYEEKDGQIYYIWVNGGTMAKENTLVKNADAASFETIKTGTKFSLGKDKKHVFFNAYVLENADPSTFINIQTSYFKDKNNVFVLQGTNVDARIIDADPKTFKILKEFSWTRDKNHVFYGRHKLEDINLQTFEVIDENWAKDGRHYFFNETKIDSLDYGTAEIVGANYIKDKKNVFYQNKLMKDANPATFKAGNYSSGYDETYRYSFEKVVGLITEEYKNAHKDFK